MLQHYKICLLLWSQVNFWLLLVLLGLERSVTIISFFPSLPIKIVMSCQPQVLLVTDQDLYPAVLSPQLCSGGASSRKGCYKGQRWADVCLTAALGFSRDHSEQHTVRKGAAAPAIWKGPQSLCAQKSETLISYSSITLLPFWTYSSTSRLHSQ